MHHLTRLPIPEANPAATISARHEVAIGTDVHVHAIPGRVVPAVALLAVLAEAVPGGVDEDLVVTGLHGDGFAGRVEGGGGDGEEVRFGDKFDGDGDVEFPCAKGFVVGSGDETGVFYESEGVYRAWMVSVLVRDG